MPHTGAFWVVENAVQEELSATNTPGAAVAIVSGDRLVFAKGFGTSNIETGAPVTPDMLFRIGSTTKLFTAATLVAQAEAGKLTLDACIGTYVNGLPPRLSQVTSHQLLSHTAGVIEEVRPNGSHDDAALARQVRAYTDDYLFTEPGRVFSYSEPGFIIAGFVAQELAGTSYADALHDRLFTPLGMHHTTFRPTMAMTFPLSQGHAASGTAPPTIVRPFVDNVGDWPAGFMFSSVLDLARFAIAFMNGGRIDGQHVLSPWVITHLATPHVDVPFSWDNPPGFYAGAKYGYGLFIQPHRGMLTVHHGGVSDGFGSFFVMVPDHRFAVIILANKTSSLFGKTAETAMELMVPLSGKPEAQRRQAVPMSDAEMDDCVGTYTNGALTVDLLAKGGRLLRRQVDETGTTFEVPVTKVAPNRFAFTPPGAAGPIEFVSIPGSDGRAAYLYTELFMAVRRNTGE